jgi:transcriptional regulator with XRE-family HTH domain
MTGKRVTPLRLWGKELRLARERAGINSQDRLAALVHVSASLVGMWESGKRIPQPDDLVKIEEVCQSDGLLTRLLNDWVGKRVGPEWLGRWVEAESEATSLSCYQTIVIPGLLQTEEYARAVLRLGKQSLLDTDNQVNTRLTRQQILSRDDPPVFHAIISEAVVGTPVGGPKVMGDQLRYLVELSERTEIIIQVIPFEAGEHAGFAGPFVLATIDGAEVAYVDSALRGDVIEVPEDVATIKRLWIMLSGKAMNEEDSIKLIAEAAEQWT